MKKKTIKRSSHPLWAAVQCPQGLDLHSSQPALYHHAPHSRGTQTLLPYAALTESERERSQNAFLGLKKQDLTTIVDPPHNSAAFKTGEKTGVLEKRGYWESHIP